MSPSGTAKANLRIHTVIDRRDDTSSNREATHSVIPDHEDSTPLLWIPSPPLLLPLPISVGQPKRVTEVSDISAADASPLRQRRYIPISRRFRSQSRSLREPTQAKLHRETRRGRDDHVKGAEDWACQDLPNPAGEMDLCTLGRGAGQEGQEGPCQHSGTP